MSQTLTCLFYHIIFSTKGRRRLIMPALRPRLNEYIGGIVRTDGGILIASGGAEDHTHVLAHINKNITIPTGVKNIKSESTKWIHEAFPELRIFSWQGGYAAFTVSKHDIPDVKAYIEHQQEHHRTLTFKEELIGLLEAHGVEYDERYLWD